MSGNGADSAPKFELGQIVATQGALSKLAADEILASLMRHVRGDWGTLVREDWQANERALRDEGRLFSVYYSTSNTKFYVITEWDRSVTTVLLPSEY